MIDKLCRVSRNWIHSVIGLPYSLAGDSASLKQHAEVLHRHYLDKAAVSGLAFDSDIQPS